MWTERLSIAFPIALLETANRLAQIIDPDSGGALTFTAESEKNGYVIAAIPFTVETRAIVEGKDLATWQAVMAQGAVAKGLDPLTADEVAELHSSILIGEECNDLG
jgi:hypothetical protein